MQKLQWAGVLCLAAVPALAQGDMQRVEVFGGYSYIRVNVQDSGLPDTLHLNFNGGSGQLAVNWNKWVGGVADFGGGKTDETIRVGGQSFPVRGNVFTYMFGPRFVLAQHEKVRPYVQALFGGARFSPEGDESENAFAMALGGGLDVKVAGHVSVRPVQVEYVLTKFDDGIHNRQNNVRISAGVVFRFGR